MAMDWKVCEEGRVYKAKSKWKKRFLRSYCSQIQSLVFVESFSSHSLGSFLSCMTKKRNA